MSVQDEWSMVCIRRANLDSFWARERSTVESNRREGMRFWRQSQAFGKADPFPSRGPVADWSSSDMFTAMNVLARSMDEGKNAKHVQFSTARRIRSFMSNYWHASTHGLGGATFISEGNTSRLTTSPTHTLWFHRFMEGCHRRMGDVWVPDRPLTIHELKAALRLLEEDWSNFVRCGDQSGLLETALAGTMLVAGFFAALRGEEICRVDVGSMRRHWKESQEHPDVSHVPLIMTGRFKREVGEKIFCQPLANESKSGIKIAVWISRSLWALEKKGIVSGPMFRIQTKSGHRKATVGDLDVVMHVVLTRVQKRWPSVIPDEVDVKKDYSVSRSCRRGSTSEAQNAGVSEDVINENNRWRKRMRARGLLPGMSMMQRYSDAKACVKSLTRYSGSL